MAGRAFEVVKRRDVHPKLRLKLLIHRNDELSVCGGQSGLHSSGFHDACSAAKTPATRFSEKRIFFSSSAQPSVRLDMNGPNKCVRSYLPSQFIWRRERGAFGHFAPANSHSKCPRGSRCLSLSVSNRRKCNPFLLRAKSRLSLYRMTSPFVVLRWLLRPHLNHFHTEDVKKNLMLQLGGYRTPLIKI